MNGCYNNNLDKKCEYQWFSESDKFDKFFNFVTFDMIPDIFKITLNEHGKIIDNYKIRKYILSVLIIIIIISSLVFMGYGIYLINTDNNKGGIFVGISAIPFAYSLILFIRIFIKMCAFLICKTKRFRKYPNCE